MNNMNEKWNQFVCILMDCKKRKVDEEMYHTALEGQLQLLGWFLFCGEICHKPNIPIGNNKFIQPDILIKKGNDAQFVIEVKRPLHSQTERERLQLLSYMRQLKVDVGVYVGEHIEVFYDNGRINSILRIPLELDNKQGVKFVEKFSKENFNRDNIVEFCKERIDEIERQASLNKIKESLIVEAQTQVRESLLPYLLEKYNHTFTENDIKGMLATLIFTAADNNENVMVAPLLNKEKTKRHYDSTCYSLDSAPAVGKAEFVYTVVAEYLKKHPQITFDELEQIFQPKLQKFSFGVIRTVEYIKNKGYKGRRYFDKPDEILYSGDNVPFAVSTQWGIGNIQNIVELARELGFNVETGSEIKKEKETNDEIDQSGYVSCSIKRNSDAHGLYNPNDQTLMVLKGSKVNPLHLGSIGKTGMAKRDELFVKYTEEKNGERIVTRNVLFKTPSGAALFCVGGASNGWTEWKDDKGDDLQKYRKDINI